MNNKTYRALRVVPSSVGRTIKKAAVIQDISFLSLFRLHGLSMEVVKDLFAEFMVPVFLHFTASSVHRFIERIQDPLDVELISEDDVLNGHREQEVISLGSRPRTELILVFLAGDVVQA